MGSRMETELPVLDPNLDYSQVPPIHQKRIVAFINHFISRTVCLLNNLSQNCDSRLMELDYKLHKMEASLSILEAQLSSVPWLNDTEVETVVNEVITNNDENVISMDLPPIETEADNTNVKNLSVDNQSVIKVSEDPRYAKFFKMIQVGVQLEAVKLKMSTEGYDPTILDNPNTLVPIDS